MNQTVNAGQNFCKCAEVHQLYDFDLGNVAFLISLGELGPGVTVGILVAQRDLLSLFVKADDVNVHLLANGDNICRVADAAPSQLGNVNHAVHTADVHKHTVRRNGFHNTFVVLADFDFFPNLLSSNAALITQHSADGADNAAALHLGDFQTHGLLHHGVHVSLPGQTGLRCGNEHAVALHGNNNAALIGLGDHAFQNFAAFSSSNNGLPALCCVQTFLGQLHSAFHVVHTDDDSFDLVADFDTVLNLCTGLIREFRRGDKSGVLHTQIHIHFGGCDCYDFAGNFITIVNGLKRFLQQLFETLFSGHFACCGFFVFDFVCHRLFYLLNDPRGCRGTGGNTDFVCRTQTN